MLKRSTKWLVLGLVIVLAFALAGCGSKSDGSTTDQTDTTQSTQQPAEQTSPAATTADVGPGKVADVTELKSEDLTVGTGAEAVVGKTVTVHYTGWLVDGSKFDSSRDSGQPFQFQIGAGKVIAGWEQGIAGMKVGGKRRLTIPSTLGYGENGYPPVIPGNATLVFDVELLAVQ